MSNTDSKLTDVAQVVIASAWASKINWGEVIKVCAAIAATRGLDVPVEVQNNILMIIISAGGLYTWIVRTWFTKTITPGSAASPGVSTSVIVKVLLLAFALSLFFPLRAFAADLPVKAPAPASQAFQFNGSGFFGGLFAEGGGGSVSASVPGVASASLTTTTAAIGLTAGYAKTSGAFAYSIEGDVSAANFNGNNAGFALTGPLSFEQRAMIWAPASVLVNAFSFLNISNIFGNLPALNPMGKTVTNQMWGIGGAAVWRDVTLAYQGVGANKVWSVAPALAVAMQDQLSDGTAIRTSLETSFPDRGAIFGARSSRAVLGPDIRARLSFIF